MQCQKLSAGGDTLLDPDAPRWAAVPAEKIPLSGTPLATQPSGYVRTRFDPQQVGKVKEVDVRTAHDDRRIYVRLAWADEHHNVAVTENNEFPDGCGVLLPLGPGDPPLQEMGSEAAPVNAWFWRADAGDQGRHLIAAGLGTTRPSAQQPVAARAAYHDGTWAVVLARDLTVAGAPGEAAPLAPGTTTKIAFAVWEGGNQERAGIKGYSREWQELVIE